MKISVLLFIIGFLHVSANSYGQETKLTIKKNNVELGNLLSYIETQSEFLFFYNNDRIDKNMKVNVDISNSTINTVLDQVLTGTNITYQVVDRAVILTEKRTDTSASFKQGIVVAGTVTDAAGDPMPGVNIVIKGTTTGQITDVNGKYSINIPGNGAVLVFSFIGYASQEFLVGDQREINVTLEEDAREIEEVVVVGFGTQKKANLTGAVASVQMDKVLGDRPVTSLGSILQGSVAGFTASSSPIPGGDNQWNIRGLESINGGSPLFLVDNVVYNDLKLLNPADIESISVLKDASSAAIYGARASFGVVLITTKKASRNETLTINYNNNFAVSKVTNLPELASPIDFVQTLKDGGYTSIWSGQNIDTYLGLLNDYRLNPSNYPKGWTDMNGTKYFLKETDVMGDMFESSWAQTHNISASGGSERINYRLSLGYTDDDGIMVTNKDAFTRTSVSGYVNGDITSWISTALDIKYNYGDKTYPFLDSSSELGLWGVNRPSYHPDGTLPYGTSGEEYPVMTPANITRLVNASKTITDNTRILSRTVVKPIKGLEGVLEYSYQVGNSNYDSYANYFQVHQGLAESIKPSTSTTPYTSERATTRYTTLNAFATYNNSFAGAHNVSLLAGFNQEKSDYKFLKSQAYNMISNELPSLSGADGSTPPVTNDKYTQYSLRSGFFRANYNFKQRYFVEFNGRYDLSSKFPKDYRDGFFPSVSAGWSIINESFMEGTRSVLSALKLRGSFGSLGNQNIGAYGYLATMPIQTSSWIYSGVLPKTLGALPMIRATYTWEKVETINGGIDFGFLNGRFNGSLDIYRRNTIGMLGPSEELPAVAGATAPEQNAADLKTNGWELSLNWRDQAGDFNYGVGLNIYDSRSYITKYKNETGLFYDRNEAQDAKRYRPDMEIGEIWGYVAEGFYTADDFNESGALKDGVVRINGVTSHAGDIRYKNLRDDNASTNVINTGDNTADNPGDRKVIGNSRARMQFGLNGFVDWKGFSLSFILQGVARRDAWIGGDIIFPMSGQYSTVYKHQLGKIWTPENATNAYYGRIYENAGSSQSANQRLSDKFLQNASYLRVKNITLSYTVPQKYIQRVRLKSLKVFVSGENLLTFDHLPTGIDPENLGWNYPYARTISFGLNLNL